MMEPQYLIFCFAVLASAASFSIPENFPEYGNASLQEVAYSNKCKCSDGKCVTDNRGNMKCVCKPGYALQDEFTCKPCDCGKKGKCIFTLKPKSVAKGGFYYEKKCVCDVGSAEKDGKCIDCYCGENSACEFNGEEKNCYCIEGYSEKDGKCTRCDCGFYGTCEFNRGIKQCTCDDGFLVLDGICEECDCGEHGTCTFMNGAKYCQCENGYKDNGGKCEACDCGDNSVECDFSDGAKICRCKAGYSDKNGVCEECNCGFNSVGCSFYQSEKICACKVGYVQKSNTCEVACSFDHPCKNGGVCTKGYCICLEGTFGEFCENINGCENLCPKQEDITCAFDVERQKPYCACLDSNLRFNPERKQCQRTCDDKDDVCLNGGECARTKYDSFCRCKNGTKGDYCEIVPECREKNCGPDAFCVYDIKSQRAVCECYNLYLSFDVRDEKCKKSCDYKEHCKNGGVCTRTEYDSFCRCKNGTEGDLCQVVPRCKEMNCGTEALCIYDEKRETAVCMCKEEQLSFDPRDVKCKNTCDYEFPCKNGGKCGRRDGSNFCECLPGTKGDFCENVMECYNMDCGKEAVCVYNVNVEKAVCVCEDATLNYDERSSKCKRTCSGDYSCSNGGKCVGGFCECPVGTSGDYCEEIPECQVKDCGYDAKCTYSLDRGSAVCTCVDDKYDFDEADKTCKRGCTTEFDCRNGGKCRQNGYSAFCDCLPGTEGDLCEVVKDCKEGRTHCKGNASCVFDQEKQKGVCACSDERKRYDVVGEECKLTCTEDATCHNGGLCMHRGDHLFCECMVGTSGNLCETVVECQKGLCGNSGKVDCIYDTSKEAAVCKCKNPDELFDPVTKTCKACDCGKNSISCRYVDGKKVCACRDGYEAKNGKCQKTKCMEKRCQNGRCDVVGDDKEVCSCYEGYQLEGDNCRKLNCSKTPCYNGTCIVRHGNREECICQDGYTLRDGFCIRGACRIDTCFGGRCDIIDGELMCVCPKNYSLQGIGCFATVCKKQHCFGGWCVVNEDKEEICTCHEGYVLVNDVCKKILCKKPCFGGQCKFIDGKEECICPPGFSIFKDVCRENKAVKRIDDEKERN